MPGKPRCPGGDRGYRMGIGKRERVALILERLAATPAAASEDAAYRMLCDAIVSVEDE
jgi:hypothetical protein